MIVFDNPAHAALLTTHIAAGGVGLAAGFAALAFRKGGGAHKLAGKVFVPAMVVMLALGGVLGIMDGRWTFAIGVVFGIYLTLTAWMTARNPDGLGRYARPLALSGAAIAVTYLVLVVLGLIFGAEGGNGGLPLAVLFGGLAALGAGTDFRALRKGGIAGPSRVRRHVWRMSVALFFASGSFFLGQMDEFPRAIQGPIWFVPAFLPFAAMLFWMWRYRDRKRRRPQPPAGTVPQSA